MPYKGDQKNVEAQGSKRKEGIGPTNRSCQVRSVSNDSRAKSRKLSPVMSPCPEGGLVGAVRVGDICPLSPINKLSLRSSMKSDSDSPSVSPSMSKNDGFRMRDRRWMVFSRTTGGLDPPDRNDPLDRTATDGTRITLAGLADWMSGLVLIDVDLWDGAKALFCCVTALVRSRVWDEELERVEVVERSRGRGGGGKLVCSCIDGGRIVKIAEGGRSIYSGIAKAASLGVGSAVVGRRGLVERDVMLRALTEFPRAELGRLAGFILGGGERPEAEKIVSVSLSFSISISSITDDKLDEAIVDVDVWESPRFRKGRSGELCTLASSLAS